MDFFERIKELSKLNHLKVEQLVEEVLPDARSPRDTYNGWRRRNSVPKGNICLDLAKRLGVTVEYLLTGSDADIDSRFEQYVKYSDLLEAVSKLSQEDYRVILSAAKKMANEK